MSNNELYHYGVKGMKWGVRRDARILMNHRYNQTVDNLKTARKLGKINRDQYSDAIRKASERKKKDLADVETKFKNAKSERERELLSKNITRMAVNEVSDIKLQRGLAVVNQMLGVSNIANIGVTTAAMTTINPAFAAAYVSAGVVTTAAEVGYRWINRSILDRLA